MNTAGNAGDAVVVKGDMDAYDEATQKLSPEFKEFLVEHDIGGYSHSHLLELIEKYGEATVRLMVLTDKNYNVYEKYGKNHPDFNPRLQYRRPKGYQR